MAQAILELGGDSSNCFKFVMKTLCVICCFMPVVASNVSTVSRHMMSCAKDDESCSFRDFSQRCCNPAASCTAWRYAGLKMPFGPTWSHVAYHCRLQGTLVNGSLNISIARNLASFVKAKAKPTGCGEPNMPVCFSSLRAVEEAIAEVANMTSNETNEAYFSLHDHAQSLENNLAITNFLIPASIRRAPRISATLSNGGVAAIQAALNRKLENFSLASDYGTVEVKNLDVNTQGPAAKSMKYPISSDKEPSNTDNVHNFVFVGLIMIILLVSVGGIFAGIFRSCKHDQSYIPVDNNGASWVGQVWM